MFLMQVSQAESERRIQPMEQRACAKPELFQRASSKDWMRFGSSHQQPRRNLHASAVRCVSQSNNHASIAGLIVSIRSRARLSRFAVSVCRNTSPGSSPHAQAARRHSAYEFFCDSAHEYDHEHGTIHAEWSSLYLGKERWIVSHQLFRAIQHHRFGAQRLVRRPRGWNQVRQDNAARSLALSIGANPLEQRVVPFGPRFSLRSSGKED
jgi:hypothetical protein